MCGKKHMYGEQRWCSGESTPFPPVWPEFDSWTRHHVWVEFIVGFSLHSPEKKFVVTDALCHCDFDMFSQVNIHLINPFTFLLTHNNY